MINYKQLQDIFLELTFKLRGYDYNDESSEGHKLISLAYQKNSQPFQESSQGMTYVWISYDDSNTNNQLNTQTTQMLDGKLNLKKSQLRNIIVHWVFYGEGIEDIAFLFRQKILSYQVKDFLDKSDIKLIPDIPECVLLFEEINNSWWPRTSIDVSYYVETTFDEIVDTIEVVKIELDTEDKKILIK